MAGTFSQVRGCRCGNTVSGTPISASTVSPHRARPGISKCAGLRRKNVTVSSQCTAPVAAPLSPQTPLGTSTATMGSALRCALASVSAAAPSSGRVKPAPNKASTTKVCPSRQDASKGRLTGVPAAYSACMACQCRQAMRASPDQASGSDRSTTFTGQPCCNNDAAATRPSPPLLPGPHSTTVGCGAQRCTMARATACPAASIRVRPGVPRSMVRASA